MDVSNLLAITLGKQKFEIKVAKWGTPKKYLKKISLVIWQGAVV
jgi:hypothetical protein